MTGDVWAIANCVFKADIEIKKLQGSSVQRCCPLCFNSGPFWEEWLHPFQPLSPAQRTPAEKKCHRIKPCPALDVQLLLRPKDLLFIFFHSFSQCQFWLEIVIAKTQDVLRIATFLTLDEFKNTTTYSSSLMTDVLDKSSGMPRGHGYQDYDGCWDGPQSNPSVRLKERLGIYMTLWVTEIAGCCLSTKVHFIRIRAAERVFITVLQFHFSFQVAALACHDAEVETPLCSRQIHSMGL